MALYFNAMTTLVTIVSSDYSTQFEHLEPKRRKVMMVIMVIMVMIACEHTTSNIPTIPIEWLFQRHQTVPANTSIFSSKMMSKSRYPIRSIWS